jgi:type II secretory pathway pseudopilin PulG
MTKPHPIRRRSRSSQEGYILIWVMFMLFIFSLWLAVAAPRVAREIQRDREVETMERGKQYIRAVQLYYRTFHAFPPNMNALVNTNNIRFLRKRYIDPMTGKDDWKPIRFGEAKTQTLGFFGQPVAGAGSAGGSVLAGTGPSGSGGIGGGSPTGPGAPAPTGAAPSGSSQSASSTSSPSSDTGLSGQTFGGAGIIGFSPASPKQSILIYKKKTHYSEWEFIYDPLTDMRTQAGNTGNIGQPASSTTTPIGSSTIGTGVGIGSGSNPSPPATPTQPKQ